MRKYYVYAHSNEKFGTFYVGKGSGERLYKTANRSAFWKRIVKKYGYTVSILDDCLSEESAFERECHWIKHFKDAQQCVANFTLGGDGVRVEKRWWNEKISQALKGRKGKGGKESLSYKDFADDELLRRLYVTESRSVVYISELLGVSIPTVCARLRQFEIGVRPINERGKLIECISTGERFDSITAAAKHYGVFRENIRKVLAGKYKTTGGLSFKYSE